MEWRCGPNCPFWYWWDEEEVDMCSYKDDEIERGSLCCASLDQWTTERTLLDDAIAARKGINPARAQAVEELVKAVREWRQLADESAALSVNKGADAAAIVHAYRKRFAAEDRLRAALARIDAVEKADG